MILISVGASNFQFDRLFQLMDEICDEKIVDGSKVVAQTGLISYQIRNYKHFEFAAYDEMDSLQNKADIIISHAGTGTVIGSLKKRKKVIVFPRLAKYKEHESDHQLDLALSFESKKYILCATNKEELINSLQSIEDFNPEPFISNTSNFLRLIECLIEK